MDELDANLPRVETEWIGEPRGKKVVVIGMRQGAQYVEGTREELIASLDSFAASNDTWFDVVEPKYGLVNTFHRNVLKDILFIGHDWLDMDAIKRAIDQSQGGSIPILRAVPELPFNPHGPGKRDNHRGKH